MDKIYVPDYIPLDYNYAVFKENGNIELYQHEYYDNVGTYIVYILYNNAQNKIITDNFGITVQEGQTYNVDYAHEVQLSHKWYDRPDCLNILLFTLVISVATIWITNIFTSVFKRGGLLGGLF